MSPYEKHRLVPHGWRSRHWLQTLASSEVGLRNLYWHPGFPGGSEVKASACNVGDLGLIPGLGRSPGEGKGNPLQYSCLEDPMDGGAWWATVHRLPKSRTRLSNFTYLTQCKCCVSSCLHVANSSFAFWKFLAFLFPNAFYTWLVEYIDAASLNTEE